MKNKINKNEGAKLIAGASALTVLVSASAAIIHVIEKLKDMMKKIFIYLMGLI